MGEVAPCPPLLQAKPFSSALGEDAWSLLGALMGAEGTGEAGTPVAVLDMPFALVLEEELRVGAVLERAGESLISWLLLEFCC